MSFFSKVFRDKNGRIVIFQVPNIPLGVFIISWAIGKVTEGVIEQFFDVLGSIALLIFALLEIFQGVNYFRRALGLVVLILLAMHIFR